jgi:hypothetical protein
VLDTIGVALAGRSASRAVQRRDRQPRPVHALGPATSASPGDAALANGTAAHALDYDDMRSSAGIRARRWWRRRSPRRRQPVPRRSLLDAYVVGFEIEARLGRAMARHYQRGWHCTSTSARRRRRRGGARLLGLMNGVRSRAGDRGVGSVGTERELGTRSPLHAGLAGRNGISRRSWRDAA